MKRKLHVQSDLLVVSLIYLEEFLRDPDLVSIMVLDMFEGEDATPDRASGQSADGSLTSLTGTLHWLEVFNAPESQQRATCARHTL